MKTPGWIYVYVHTFRFIHMYTHSKAHVLPWSSEQYQRADFCRGRLALTTGGCLDQLQALGPQRSS